MTDSEKIEYLMAAVNELLRRVGGVAPQAPAQEYWPSSIPGQRIPRITGNPSIDFAAAAIGMHNAPQTPERDANLAAGEAELAAQTFTGPVVAAWLSQNDAAYLWHRHHDYRIQVGRDLFTDLLSGKLWDINNAKQTGDRINPSMGAWMPDNGNLPGLVDELFSKHRK